MGDRRLSSSCAKLPVCEGGARTAAVGIVTLIGDNAGAGLLAGAIVPRPRPFSWSFLDGCAVTRGSTISPAIAGTIVGMVEAEFLDTETISEYDGLDCAGLEPGLKPVGVRGLLVGLLFKSMTGWPDCSNAILGTFVLAVR